MTNATAKFEESELADEMESSDNDKTHPDEEEKAERHGR